MNKITAEEKGLVVEHEKTVGYGVTKLNDKLLELVPQINIDATAFTLVRDRFSKPTSATKQKQFKYSCECGKNLHFINN